jgi:biopolymer transport protein ExbB
MDMTGRMLAFALHGAGWVLWLLIGLSVASLAVMLERIWYFTRHRPGPDLLLKDMRALLGTRASGEAVGAAMEGAKAQERIRLERNLAFLATLGSNAPFIGLFGTVLGIIKAFHDLSGGQAGGPSVVMGSISEALVATAVGLMVAIPAVVAFNVFSRRVKTKMAQVEWMAHLARAQLEAERGPAGAQ